MRPLLLTGLLVLITVTNAFPQGKWRAMGTEFPSMPTFRNYERAPTPFDDLTLPKEATEPLLNNPKLLTPRMPFRQAIESNFCTAHTPTGYIPKFNRGPFTRPWGWPTLFWPYDRAGSMVVRSRSYPWIFFYEEEARVTEVVRRAPPESCPPFAFSARTEALDRNAGLSIEMPPAKR